MKPWIAYTLIRLALFVGLLALLMYLGAHVILAGVLAAVLSFLIAYIFFQRMRDAVALDLAERRNSPAPDADAADEDAAVEDRR